MDDSLKIYRGRFSELFLVLISAIILSLITADKLSKDIPEKLFYFIILALFFLVLFLFTLGVLSVINTRVKYSYGIKYIYGSVVHGFMLLLPFAVLLFVTDELLKWNTFQTITATSIITSVSYSIYDIIRLGGNKAGNTIMSLIIGVLFILFFFVLVTYKIIN